MAATASTAAIVPHTLRDGTRGSETAADDDFADPLDLRQLLRQHRGRRVVQLAAMSPCRR